MDWIGHGLEDVGISKTEQTPKKSPGEVFECLDELREKAMEVFSDPLYEGKNESGEKLYRWRGDGITGLVELTTTDENFKGGPTIIKRWARWIDWKCAVYFLHSCVVGFDEIDGHARLPDLSFGDMRFDPLLVDSLPTEVNSVEEAVRYAKELTDFGTKGREKYRLEIFREGGPGYPRRLLKKVADHLECGQTTVSDYLRNGGFRLPLDLRLVRKPKRKG